VREEHNVLCLTGYHFTYTIHSTNYFQAVKEVSAHEKTFYPLRNIWESITDIRQLYRCNWHAHILRRKEGFNVPSKGWRNNGPCADHQKRLSELSFHPRQICRAVL